MAKATQQSSDRKKQLRKKFKGWTLWFMRVIIYLHLATLANIRSMWSWTSEPRGFNCDHPPRGAAYNRTKMKALVYGLAKTGTTSTADFLHQIYPRSWHSEEFLLHVWAPLADKYWLREENGGSIWPWGRLATPAYPAYKGHSFWTRVEYGSDRIADSGIDAVEFATALEKCAVDSMTFDGMENLFWKMYEISPEAKVIMLNWRDYKSYVRSGTQFGIEVFVGLLALNYLNCGQHYLPWNAFAIPLLDYFMGDATHIMVNGNRMMDYNSLLILLFRQSVTERRFCQHWHSGHGINIQSEQEYHEYWDYARKRVPKERLIELNLKKHSAADFCKMLGVTDNPRCKDTGKLPNVYPLLNMETKMWHWMLTATPWFLFIHWVNYHATWSALYWAGGKFLGMFFACASLVGYSPERIKAMLKAAKKDYNKKA